MSGHVPMRLVAMEDVAANTRLFAFEPLDGRQMPPATPGAHVDVHLPAGVRQYSLVLDPSQRYPIVVAVKREVDGRGGSRWLHDSIGLGSEITVGPARNNFRLTEAAKHSVLIAGGIGISPIWSMLHRLEALGASFELHYACRTRTEMAFFDRLDGREGVHLHFDNEAGHVLDIAAICRVAPVGAHLYCCGPVPMLLAFETATKDRPERHVHVESFASRESVADQGGFDVELARSGLRLHVAHGDRILDTLRAAGVDVLVSCEQGVCGSCETIVLEGVPDHRCEVLSPAERAAGRTMMVCCSGSKSSRLVLDL